MENPGRLGSPYFPLANDSGLLSAITPDLAGDTKIDQHTFLTTPVSIEDLRLSRASRNFWVTFPSKSKLAPWSVTGRSVWQRASGEEEPVTLEAGFLWQKIRRVNKRLGIQATTLSLIPQGQDAFEILWVEIKNTGRRPLDIIGTSAVPLFGRSADNLRDHRHVTSLLHRLSREKYGLRLIPTMSFNERDHLINRTVYYVIGMDDKGRPPAGLFPTMESFTGPDGDLEKPGSLLNRTRPVKKPTALDQGKEAIGALQFGRRRLGPGESASHTILLGIDQETTDHEAALRALQRPRQIEAVRAATETHWKDKIGSIRFHTGNAQFDNWIQWVQIQPALRRLFGCSFLPDFDYGRGGRGWRDLWQDCLALLLSDPEDVREDIVHNYGGVRLDGSNATIISRRREDDKRMPEFIADRNNIARTWMDHGVWPFLTTLLYIDQTGDWDILLQTAPYFRDALIERGKKVDPRWPYSSDPDKKTKLTTQGGKIYRGSILEHILIQTLVPFFHVGEHNIIRLEDADWNDGLDMASVRGESVAFTAFYAGNLGALVDLLEKLKNQKSLSSIAMAQEAAALFDPIEKRLDYNDIQAKRTHLTAYFDSIASGISGRQLTLPIEMIINDLRAKASWIREHLNRQEWIETNGEGWYNGYYDNQGRRVEGKDSAGRTRMTLPGQVFPLMFGMANPERVKRVVAAVNRHLFDKRLGGVRLNTDFGDLQPDLGRAFSFAYGEKENGAIFSHMAVMYASALYRSGAPSEGFRVLDGLFRMSSNGRSRIFPGLPEYFNNEGRGRYAYLTGSASWYVLTLLTQAFGVRGERGDLFLAPQLDPSQFDRDGRASVSIRFAGTNVTVTYRNPKRVKPENAALATVTVSGTAVPLKRRSPQAVLIAREWIANQKSVELTIDLK